LGPLQVDRIFYIRLLCSGVSLASNCISNMEIVAFVLYNVFIPTRNAVDLHA